MTSFFALPPTGLLHLQLRMFAFTVAAAGNVLFLSIFLHLCSNVTFYSCIFLDHPVNNYNSPDPDALYAHM